MTQQFSSYGEMVEQVIKTCGPDIRLATILGLGKPNRLINALYDAVKGRDDLSLTIYTALSLNPPEASSDLESRFLTPFIERLYGKNFPRLKYADDMKAGRLPDNIHVEEFYTQPGSYVKSPQGQQNYNSLNYTEVADALSTKDINVVFQRVASKESGRYSLSSNTDLTQDVLERIHQAGQPRPYCVAEVDRNLPWVGGKAEMPAGFFDTVLDVDTTNDQLFALPRQPVSDSDFAIGFYASLLVKDGGTLQVGIGALADALCYALVLRHTDNALYRKIINALTPDILSSDLVREYGGCEPFQTGVYGCSEMVNEGFRVLVEHGIMKRRVVDDLALMRKLNSGELSADEKEVIETEGKYLRGGFYLGSPEFYQWIGEQGAQENTLEMDRIGRINSITGPDYELEVQQRRHARFMNICMMATPLGGAASETLPDGRVVSGVGGQYNFVSMAADLPEARSVLMFHAARGEKSESNIRWDLPNLTIPRHLRDIYVTEYGIADLRFASDEECIKRMLRISSSDAVTNLKESAVAAGKLGSSVDSNELNLDVIRQRNTLGALEKRFAAFRRNGSLIDYPLGSDFTQVEQRLVKALQVLKKETASSRGKIRLLYRALTTQLPDYEAELERMRLTKSKSLREKLTARIVKYALYLTQK